MMTHGCALGLPKVSQISDVRIGRAVVALLADPAVGLAKGKDERWDHWRTCMRDTPMSALVRRN